MNIGIIGSEAAKFTSTTQELARQNIENIIATHNFGAFPMTVVSGHCHLGGIDIWAENAANLRGLPTLIFPPKQLSWERGYKPRNIQIATASDIIYVITPKELPSTYKGMTFKGCYHCAKHRVAWDKQVGVETYLKAYNYHDDHIKSGACWTAWYGVEKLGKEARWIVI